MNTVEMRSSGFSEQRDKTIRYTLAIGAVTMLILLSAEGCNANRDFEKALAIQPQTDQADYIS